MSTGAIVARVSSTVIAYGLASFASLSTGVRRLFVVWRPSFVSCRVSSGARRLCTQWRVLCLLCVSCFAYMLRCVDCVLDYV